MKVYFDFDIKKISFDLIIDIDMIDSFLRDEYKIDLCLNTNEDEIIFPYITTSGLIFTLQFIKHKIYYKVFLKFKDEVSGCYSLIIGCDQYFGIIENGPIYYFKILEYNYLVFNEKSIFKIKNIPMLIEFPQNFILKTCENENGFKFYKYKIL